MPAIGSHACKALAAAGYRPVTYDNLSIGNRWAVRWGPLERGDILDPSRIKEICRELKVSRKVVRKVLRSGATEFTY